MKYTKAERIEIANKVADLYLKDMFTLASCCLAVGVDYATFRNWAAPSVADLTLLPPSKQKELFRRGLVPEVHSLIKETKQRREVMYANLVLDKAYTALLKQIEGYYYKTRTTIERPDSNGDMKIVGRKIHKKYRHPNIQAIILVLTRLSPLFHETSDEIVNTHDQAREQIRSMSDEQLRAEFSRLQQELNDIP